LDVLCQVFEWDKSTIFSSWNRRDKNKPYAFKARDMHEWKRNELKMRAARGEKPLWIPESAIDPNYLAEVAAAKPKRRRRKRKNPPA